MWKKIKKIYSEIREFIWPRLEGDPIKPKLRSASQFLEQLKNETAPDKINRLLEISKEISEREDRYAGLHVHAKGAEDDCPARERADSVVQRRVLRAPSH